MCLFCRELLCFVSMTSSVFTWYKSVHNNSFSSRAWEKKVLKVDDYENNHKLTPLLYKRINLDMRTLSISFKLLRDTTILLSSTSCLLNTARTSSSCTKKQEKHINTIFVGYLNLYKKVNKRHKAHLRRK